MESDAALTTVGSSDRYHSAITLRVNGKPHTITVPCSWTSCARTSI
jgi:hypothetical protein